LQSNKVGKFWKSLRLTVYSDYGAHIWAEGKKEDTYFVGCIRVALIVASLQKGLLKKII